MQAGELQQVTGTDQNWTLFLDRDGVLNVETLNEYVLNTRGFVFLDRVKEALRLLNGLFGRLVLVTNQRGVSKGLMTVEDLEAIHAHMVGEIVLEGGRLDKIYYCTDGNNDSPNRKPNPGMAHQARLDFPDIDFSRSIMVGNKLSDMAFGRNAGMRTCFIASTNPETPFPHADIDYRFNSLYDFACAVAAAR